MVTEIFFPLLTVTPKLPAGTGVLNRCRQVAARPGSLRPVSRADG